MRGHRPRAAPARPTSTRGSGPGASRCSGAAGRRRLQRLVDVGRASLAVGGRASSSPCASPLLDVDADRGRRRRAHQRRRRRRGRRASRRGDQLIDVDLARRRAARSRPCPWVARRPRVHRGIDGAVAVAVTERTPVAVVGEGGDGRRSSTPRAGSLGPALGDPSPPPRWCTVDGLGAGPGPGASSSATRPPTPWRVAAPPRGRAWPSARSPLVGRRRGRPLLGGRRPRSRLRRRQPARGQGPLAAHGARAGRSHLPGRRSTSASPGTRC